METHPPPHGSQSSRKHLFYPYLHPEKEREETSTLASRASDATRNPGQLLQTSSQTLGAAEPRNTADPAEPEAPRLRRHLREQLCHGRATTLRGQLPGVTFTCVGEEVKGTLLLAHNTSP